MNAPKLRWLFVALIIEVAAIVVGIGYYRQGPTPYMITLKESDTRNLTFEGGKWLFEPLDFPLGRVYARFALNMNLSVRFNDSEPGLSIYLLNESQFLNWNYSKADYVLAREYPNYNFSVQVEPDYYYLAINASNLQGGNSTQASSDIVVVAQIFDYTNVWPYLCLALAGIIAANVTVFLMGRGHAFARIDSFLRAMYVPRADFPRKGSYARYSLEVYDKLIKPLLAWITPLVPALLAIAVVLRAWPRGTSPFTSVAWDYVALAAITLYFIVVGFVILFLFLFLSFVPRIADLALFISERLSILKAVDITVMSKIQTASLSEIRKKRSIPLISSPLILFAALVLITSPPPEPKLPYYLWIALILMLVYYGLVFAYISSISLKKHLSAQFPKHTRRHLSGRLRLFSLIDAVTSTVCEIGFFLATVSALVSLFFYVFIPITSSSLAVRYGLTAPTNLGSIDVFILLMEVVFIGFLLVWSIFYGITGYLVPELLDRGLRGSSVALLALFLTFLTERALSTLFDPYLNIDWTLSLLFSFPVFALILIFEKFYRRMLRRYEN